MLQSVHVPEASKTPTAKRDGAAAWVAISDLQYRVTLSNWLNKTSESIVLGTEKVHHQRSDLAISEVEYLTVPTIAALSRESPWFALF
jgi:hypothetical protein